MTFGSCRAASPTFASLTMMLACIWGERGVIHFASGALFTFRARYSILRVRYSFCEGDWREDPMRRPECRSPEGGHESEKPDIGTVLDIRIERAGHPDRRRRGQGGESHGRRRFLSRRPPVV